MKLTKLTSGLSKMTGRAGLVLKHHSPEILLVVGIAGTVGSAVLACRATLRVEEVLDTHREKIGKIHDCWEKVKEGEIPLDDYDEKDHKKDLTVTYVQTAVDFIKLYGPSVTLGIASIACIVGGHGIMKKRYVGVLAAYKAVEDSFKAYRKRVVEDFGEERDYMYKNGLRAETITETEEGPDGKPVKVKKEVLVKDPNGYSDYAKFFDETCSEWTKDPEYNLMVVRSQQNYWNDILRIKGHVFLNEVYDSFGIPRTQAGAHVGWFMGKEGDNFIDFGVFDGDNPRSRAFVNGLERSILLDFNVDGVIWNFLGK